MNDTDTSRALLGLTAQIVSAHLKHNKLPAADLPGLILQVHGALANAGSEPVVEPEKPVQPAAPKRTIFTDYIICLEDGRKLKTLKRHLRSTYNMSPDDYREKWGLPADYPMVAPSYAARRSSLAKSLGLGRKSAKDAAPAPEPAQAPLPLEHTRAFTIAPAVAKPAAPPSPTPTQQAFAAPPQHRESRVYEPTLESVFAKFPNSANGAEEEMQEGPPPAAPVDAPEPASKRGQRKPFSKQLARTMRP